MKNTYLFIVFLITFFVANINLAAKPNSEYFLAQGERYLNGVGVYPNTEKALYYFSRAALLGNREAKFQYGALLYNTGDYLNNYNSAIKFLTQAANCQHVMAQSLLGRIYFSEGSEQDFKKAVYWLKKAANSGEVEAMYTLGQAYRLGRGVKTNHQYAIRYLWPIANAGHSGAQNLIGNAYQTGLGLPQNYYLAARFYEYAALSGNSDAQFNLGVLYQKGFGVAPDLVKAYQFNELAASSGLQSAHKARQILVKHMTAEQVVHAQMLASEVAIRSPSSYLSGYK